MLYTLHAAPGSCSFAPHIVLEEIGEPYSLALMSPRGIQKLKLINSAD